jgi:hypothetical protein
VTLTSAVLYLTILMHTQNRMQQAALLQQQRLVLSDFYEPKEPEPEPEARVVPVGLVEMAKDRWNRLAQSEGRCGGQGELVTGATTHEDEDANIVVLWTIARPSITLSRVFLCPATLAT